MGKKAKINYYSEVGNWLMLAVWFFCFKYGQNGNTTNLTGLLATIIPPISLVLSIYALSKRRGLLNYAALFISLALTLYIAALLYYGSFIFD